jgi:uncharacterized protein (DUF1501 family)
MDRRDFLKLSGKTAAALGMSNLLLDFFLSEFNAIPHALANGNDQPAIVTIYLSGGNDGISTVIPYTDAAYYDNRPTLAYQPEEVIPLDARIGFHPSLKGLKNIYDDGKLALIEGVGYDNSSRSHFRGAEIWETAMPDTFAPTGWLGRYLDVVNDQKYPLMGLSIGATSKIFVAENNQVPTIGDIRNFKFVMGVSKEQEEKRNFHFEKIYRGMKEDHMKNVAEKGVAALKASSVVNSVVGYQDINDPYPKNNYFANQLGFISQCISSQLNTKSYFVQTGGYDEHDNERRAHGPIMNMLDQAVYGFYQDLKQKGILDRVVILIYSEFGRRIKENGNGGTDHGAAGPVFVIGGKVKGGLYGEYPNFNKLDIVGDFKYSVDFRSVYATILDKFMQTPSKDILYGKTFENLPFL